MTGKVFQVCFLFLTLLFLQRTKHEGWADNGVFDLAANQKNVGRVKAEKVGFLRSLLFSSQMYNCKALLQLLRKYSAGLKKKYFVLETS